MKAIVGLGNPGTKYLMTRHNLGFMVVDEFAEVHGLRITKKKADALTGEGVINGESVVLIKPQTYMNLSGTSVRALAAFYKIDAGDLIVVHDELDLDPWAVRVKNGGGAGGHKGVKSIMDCLGRADFIRVRMGIGKPDMRGKTEGYVLERFSAEDLEKAAEAVHRACDAVEEIVLKGVGPAMNRFNVRSKQESIEENIH